MYIKSAQCLSFYFFPQPYLAVQLARNHAQFASAAHLLALQYMRVLS